MTDAPHASAAEESAQPSPWEAQAVAVFMDHVRLVPLSEIRLPEIAAEIGVDFGTFFARFPTVEALLIAFGQQIDRRTLAIDPDDYAGEPVRDRLFDVIMRRLEALGPYKDSLNALAGGLRRDPFVLPCLLPSFRRAMTGMLVVAGVEMTGPLAHARGLAFSAAYLSVVRTWLKDHSPDQGETMAALDKALDRIAFIIRQAKAAGPEAATHG